MDRDYEVMKAELWTKVWVASASSSNCTRKIVCTDWADEAVKEFELRFKDALTKEKPNV